jgi:hypothetical protein
MTYMQTGGAFVGCESALHQTQRSSNYVHTYELKGKITYITH